ncbi:hypothetical protein CVT24_011771 [Panaeolus cyanescens]|uniref:WW domain-containing protein n=1 Tax=Panaeolus cyanescens TaxID=181874 RepID=A0A409VHJ8_9AGAR|nr:hypothetical protein CVT24_011771 [Panaeolus cyanescens]
MSDMEDHTHDGDNQNTMAFMDTATGSDTPPNERSTPLPTGWRQYKHPNGDVYFYHQGFRLITPDNIRDPDILEYVFDARDHQLDGLLNDSTAQNLPEDYEMIIMEANDETAMIQMLSREQGVAFEWTEDGGLMMESSLSYWSLIAEYPSHFPILPPRIEDEFLSSLQNARLSIATGTRFVYTELEIDRIYARYQYLNDLRSQGRNSTPSIAWLIGSVMPLDELGRRVNDEQMAALINGLHF